MLKKPKNVIIKEDKMIIHYSEFEINSRAFWNDKIITITANPYCHEETDDWPTRDNPRLRYIDVDNS